MGWETWDYNDGLFAAHLRGTSSGLNRKHAFYMLFEGLGDHVVVAQTAKALARLFRKAVVSTLLGAADAAATGDFEPLCSGFSGFHLGHDSIAFWFS
jgi:hypothetical protein